MKLVDIFYVSKTEELTSEEERKQKEFTLRQINKVALLEARIRKEEAIKQKDMKRIFFGKYVTRVPVLKEDRYRDVPLPQSQATPYIPPRRTLNEVAMEDAGYRRTRIPGQHLIGDMIPTIEMVHFTEAPVGQAIAHPNVLNVGRDVLSIPESTASAYAKIGALVGTAVFVTWFAVPLVAALADQIMGLS